MNGLAIAQEEATKLEVVLDDAALDYILWEETGWPAFFEGDPEVTLRKQLQTALIPVAERQKKRRRAELHETLPTSWERLGED